MKRRSRVSDRAMASDARTVQVEITLTWGSTVVQTISLCPPRDIHVGDDDCPVPDEPLGVPRLPLLVVHEGEPCLVVWPDARGTVALPGEGARPLDQHIAEGAARPWSRHRGFFTLPLPAGSSAEIALGRPGARSVYRVPSGEGRMVLHVAVTRVPRSTLHRSMALRYGAIAAISLSALAHASAFTAAREAVPALLPPEEDGLPAPAEGYRTIRVITGPLAEREPEQEWDHIRGPLDASDYDGFSCGARAPYCPLGIGTDWAASTATRASRTPRDEPYTYLAVPPELSGCFARPAHEPGWPFPPPGHVTRAAGESPRVIGGRARRPTPLGAVYGRLVVDDEEPLSPYYVPSPWLRAPRPERPRLAFGARAVEILGEGLAQAEPAFAWCYQRALEDHPALSGRVAMRLAAPDGRGGVDAERSDVEDPELQCCLSNAQRLWAPRVHGAELRYVIDLRRDG